MKIVTVPNAILTTKSNNVIKFDASISKIVTSMTATLLNKRDPEGVGLAAPQVGLPLRLFIIKPTKKSSIEVFINPVLLGADKEKIDKSTPVKKKNKDEKDDGSAKLEGCLSIPFVWGDVLRKESVKVAYQNVKGEHMTKEFTGFAAVIIQHEMDHLDGILFTQRVLEQGRQLYKEVNGELVKYEI